MNEIIERLEELREQGEMVSRISAPFLEAQDWFVCAFGGPFGFHETFRFKAESEDQARELCTEAINWLYPNALPATSHSSDGSQSSRTDIGKETAREMANENA
jgi:hypothetical protein